MNNRPILQAEMERLRHDILTMSSLVGDDLGKALAALRKDDSGLAKEVKANDAAVAWILPHGSETLLHGARRDDIYKWDVSQWPS